MINFNSEECEFDKVRFCVLGEYEIVRFLCNVYEKCDIAGEWLIHFWRFYKTSPEEGNFLILRKKETYLLVTHKFITCVLL